MVHSLNRKHGFMNLLCISKPYVPSSLTSGKSMDNQPKMKTKPGLEDEDGLSYVQRQCHAPPTRLLASVIQTTNTCTTITPGKIIGTYTLYLYFSIVSHEANMMLPLRVFAFPFLVNRVYSFFDDHTTVEHKMQNWTFSFN